MIQSTLFGQDFSSKGHKVTASGLTDSFGNSVG
jgi:hypothetical protein